MLTTRTLAISIGAATVLACAPLERQRPTSGGEANVGAYTNEQSRDFHAQFDLATWQTTNNTPLARYTLTRTAEFFPQATVRRAGPPVPLERAPRRDVGEVVAETDTAGRTSLLEYLRASETDAFVVVHQGRVVFEQYPRMRPGDRHLIWSVTKPFVSLAVAQLGADGRVDIRKPIETYIPALADTAWRGTTIVDILDHTSGMDALENDEQNTWLRPELAVFQFESSLGLLRWTPAADRPTYEVVASIKRLRPAGERFEYLSVNTFVLGWLVEAVTDQPLSEWLSTHIWQRLGAESDAGLIVSPRTGAAASHGGLCMTPLDLARFGLLYTPSWSVVAETPVVPDGYVRSIQRDGRPHLLAAAGPGSAAVGRGGVHSTRQWDAVWADGDFFKAGFRGQGLYVSPGRDLVVVFFSSAMQDQWRYARAIATADLAWNR